MVKNFKFCFIDIKFDMDFLIDFKDGVGEYVVFFYCWGGNIVCKFIIFWYRFMKNYIIEDIFFFNFCYVIVIICWLGICYFWIDFFCII